MSPAINFNNLLLQNIVNVINYYVLNSTNIIVYNDIIRHIV